ncbi:MAG: hypothetical protein IJJ85_01875 [Clostridia bacterium]|nr:hypothetical protein [Clostridia bacterium]
MSLYSKIVSFLMSVIAFFTGLFSNTDKKQDPTLQPDPAAPGVIDAELYGLPVFEAGEKTGFFRSAGSTEVLRYDKTCAADFSAYRKALLDAGFEVYDEHGIENNLFATLINDTLTVNLSWFAGTGTLRIVAEERGPLCPLTDESERICDTLLTGMKGETTVASEGMGYIIRLPDGSFCIIDGGMGDPDHVDADKLMGILNAQKPEGTDKPVIAAWIFTHLHGDHVGVFNCFSLDHHDDVVIEKLIYNFPKEEEIALSDSPYMLDDSIYRWNQFKKNLADFYPDVPVVKVHTGNRFAVRVAAFEVLFTLDDLYPSSILNGNGMNESSLLLKMTLEGQTFLWTGDFGFISADLVLLEYKNTLSCDFLQLAHHGMNGTAELYNCVDPTFTLLPVWNGGLSAMLKEDQNRLLVCNPTMRQMIVTGCGTWTIRLPYDPAFGTYLRIPTDKTVYPAYPDLLGEKKG